MNEIYKVELDVRASQSLALEGLRNEISRQIQSFRKTIDLQILDKPDIVFKSNDEFILAAARVHKDYLISECMINNLEILQGENIVQIDGETMEYSSEKWHVPVGIEDRELYFCKGDLYKHYWDALDAWTEL